MKVNDKVAWERFKRENNHGVGPKATVAFIEAWADLMEARMARGETIDAIAQQTSVEAERANYELTGALFQIARRKLIEVWVHGKEFSRWRDSMTIAMETRPTVEGLAHRKFIDAWLRDNPQIKWPYNGVKFPEGTGVDSSDEAASPDRPR